MSKTELRESVNGCSIDIVFVTYNSERWIEDCIASISASHFDLKQISLYFVDNASSDSTCEKLYEAKKNYGAKYANFSIVLASQNLGFGKGNNVGAALGNSKYLFFLNIDTTLYADTLCGIFSEITKDSQEVALWELRQFPYEHPKFYNPINLETTWCSGAAFIIRRKLFEEIGGFDENIFMYGEDVDLSWRARARGYTIRYLPKVAVNHYSYQTPGEIKPVQAIYSIINNLYLRKKFGNSKDVINWYKHTLAVSMHKMALCGERRALLSAWFKQLPIRRQAVRWKKKNSLQHLDANFDQSDYELCREGAFYFNERSSFEPLVSIIVRTCGRPLVLKEALISLRNQTYKNLEIVIVEDGLPISEPMIKQAFSDLNIRYTATGEKVGRCVTGNLAMEMASGKYLNFLDDDDLFFADHVEVLVNALEKHPQHQIAYALAFETPIIVESVDPYRYRVLAYNILHNYRFSRLKLLQHNCFPIQAVMFARSVYQELGGLDTELDYLEDWNLWVRYATKHLFLFIPKTTSIYRVPGDPVCAKERATDLEKALEVVREKHVELVFGWKQDEIFEDCRELSAQFTSNTIEDRICRKVYKGLRSVKGIIKRVKMVRRI